MRFLGPLLFVAGCLALAAPLFRYDFPISADIAEGSLRIVGGCLVTLGVTAFAMNRDSRDA
jgi:uncharacterized protein YjeT (DUF2065 family)